MTNNIEMEIAKYKTEHELEHHWQMKKKFMLMHYNKFPMDKLVSLAQTYYNIEVLGCRYDPPVMQRVKALSSGITSDRVTREKEKFNRGFMPASDAATERVKARLNRTPATPPGPPVESNMAHAAQRPLDFVREGAFQGGKDAKASILESRKRRFMEAERRQNEDASPTKQPADWLKTINIEKVMTSGPFGKAIVFESANQDEHPSSIIARSASASHMAINYSFIPNKGEILCKIQLDGLFLANAKGPNQKEAKEEASRIAVSRLKQTCFTVQVKCSFTSSAGRVGKDFTPDTKKPPQNASLDRPIDSDNIGSKMLKLMGWTGGGLGRDEQGTSEPVSLADHQITRSGLGSGGDFIDFKRKARQLIEEFAISDSREDLVFSPDFSKDERKVIHEMVRKYNLRSRSFGKEEDKRFLVVFKKVSPVEIVEELISCGGETEKYKLIPPSSYLDL